MNYLAHLFLADDDTQSIIGNLMGDFVKGHIDESLNPQIRQAILMHRKIDAYTDTHAVVRRSKRRLRAEYRRYGGILVDLYYDHFLALHWSRYSAVALEDFTTYVYRLLRSHQTQFPAPMQRRVSYMIANDLLQSYRQIDGIRHALHGIEGRLKRQSRLSEAVLDLEVNYKALDTDFSTFFLELIDFASQLNLPRQPLEVQTKPTGEASASKN